MVNGRRLLIAAVIASAGCSGTGTGPTAGTTSIEDGGLDAVADGAVDVATEPLPPPGQGLGPPCTLDEWTMCSDWAGTSSLCEDGFCCNGFHTDEKGCYCGAAPNGCAPGDICCVLLTSGVLACVAGEDKVVACRLD